MKRHLENPATPATTLRIDLVDDELEDFMAGLPGNYEALVGGGGDSGRRVRARQVIDIVSSSSSSDLEKEEEEEEEMWAMDIDVLVPGTPSQVLVDARAKVAAGYATWLPHWWSAMLGGRESAMHYVRLHMRALWRLVQHDMRTLANDEPGVLYQLYVESRANVDTVLDLTTEERQCVEAARRDAIPWPSLPTVIVLEGEDEDDQDVEEKRYRETVLLPRLGTYLRAAPTATPRVLPISGLHHLTYDEQLALAREIEPLLLQASDRVPHARESVEYMTTLLLTRASAQSIGGVLLDILYASIASERPTAALRALLQQPAALPHEWLVDALVAEGEPLRQLLPPAVRSSSAWAESQERGRVRRAVWQAMQELLDNGTLAAGRTPYAYQQAIVQWAIEREILDGYGGLISVDTGMGKTGMTLLIARLVPRVRELLEPANLRAGVLSATATLVLAPLAVIRGWAEDNKNWFSPDGGRLRLGIWHGEQGKLPKDEAEEQLGVTTKWQVVITTIETFINHEPWYTLPWSRIVVDEAHVLANPKGKRYKKLVKIFAAARRPRVCCWGLTATPFRNKPRDLRAQLELMGVPLPPPLAPDPDADAEGADVLEHVYRAEYGPNTVQPPEKDVQEISVKLDAREKHIYDKAYNHARDAVQRWGAGSPWTDIFAAMTRLRQSAISFDLIPPEQLTKWGEIAEALEAKLLPRGGEIPARDLPTAAKQLVVLVQGEKMGQAAIGYTSERMRAVLRACERIGREHPDEKMIIFSEFARVLRKLQLLLSGRVAWKSALYVGTGSMGNSEEEKSAEKRRQAALVDFEKDPQTRALFMTYKAGGAGMNLQHANHIIEVDQPWTEATQHQAEGRAWRIGQTRKVHILRFYAPDTFEEFVLDKQRAKNKTWLAMRGEVEVEGEVPGAEEEEEEEEEAHERGAIQNLVRAFFA